MKVAPQGTDDFDFGLIGVGEKVQFPGYISAVDKTALTPGAMVLGSLNMVKKLTGTLAPREGMKLRGEEDATEAGIDSSYEWNTSVNITRVLRVLSSGKLQVESTIVDGSTPLWYDLLTGLGSLTRFVFDSVYNAAQARDQLVMVNGDNTLKYWGGGITLTGVNTNLAINMQGNNALLTSIAVNSIAAAPSLVEADNGLAGINAFMGFVMKQQPANGEVFNFVLSGNTFACQFVTVLAGNGQVKIGANVAATFANFLDLLQNPSVTNANHQAFGATGQTQLGYFTVTQGYAIAKQDTATTWAQDGFYIDSNAANKQVVINGVTYTYKTGENSIYLMGVTPDPTAIPAGSVAIQAVITLTDPADAGDDYTYDFLKTIGNQLYIGSYNSRLVYVSEQGDFTNYTVPSPRTPGDPELITLDDAGRGITVQNKQPIIAGGLGSFYTVIYENVTVGSVLNQQTNVVKEQVADLSGVLAHEFIDVVGNTIVYLDQQNQLRTYGTYRNINQPKYPTLSLAVQQEFQGVDFTGGHVRAIGDTVHITAPAAGKDYEYQIREVIDEVGNITAERLWQSPQARNISRIALVDGIVYGYSNQYPQMYQLYDTGQWHDDSPSGELAYDARATFAYTRAGNRRQGITTFSKVYYEGYMTEGTDLESMIYFDYKGSEGTEAITINSPSSPATFFNGPDPLALGQATLGDNPLGDSYSEALIEQELLPKFRAITDVNPVNAFEYQISVYSNTPDARWELLCFGTNATIDEQQATFIRK